MKNNKRNLGSYPALSVVFASTLSLFVLGIAGMLIILNFGLREQVMSELSIQLYLKDGLSAEQINGLNEELSAKDYVYAENGDAKITFKSKAEEAKRLKEELGGEVFAPLEGVNPLKDVYVVHLAPEYATEEKVKEIRKDLEKNLLIYEIVHQQDMMVSVNKNTGIIYSILLAVAVLLSLITFVLLNNTIKLALFSQRFLIRSMQLVGATSQFIKKPYVMKAFRQGVLSGAIAATMVFAIGYYLNGLIEAYDLVLTFYLMGALCVVGGLIGVISCRWALKKYLKLSLDELY